MSANNNNNNSNNISNNDNLRCVSFKAHQLKPDKCKNCFGDKSKHPPAEAPPKTDNGDKVTTGDQSAPPQSKDDVGQEASACPAANTSGRPSSPDDRDRLIERYEREISKLREDLGVALSNQQDCDQCRTYKAQLDTCKSRCCSLESERDQLKEEVKNMEREMEEMHDTFKEEESEQFEQTKQELDLAMKNCKILQIRLHKAERQYNQLEQLKSMLEQQLQESNNRLQQEPANNQQSGVHFIQLGNDYVKLATSEYDKLLKDLSDTFEREKDLQEQIKYSQEEAQLKSDRLQSVEAENEILLNKVNKLTLANSRLRANSLAHRQQSANDDNSLPVTTTNSIREATEVKSELIQENEQLELALDFAQSECDRLKNKFLEAQSKLDSLRNALQLSESKRIEFEQELHRLKLRRQASFEASGGGGIELEVAKTADQVSKLERECRQLRSKLVQSERENRQLKLITSSASSMITNDEARQSSGHRANAFLSIRGGLNATKSHSMDTPPSSSSSPLSVGNGSEQARYRELNRQLREQCDSLREQNERLEQRLEDLTVNSISSKAGEQSNMESDLLEKLKRRLDFSESELAKVRSRLVEMDLECSRVQRQHKRLVESLENSSSDASGMMTNRRRVKLPPEPMRDSMSRQELRQAIRDLEEELEECLALLRAKDCLITERASEANNSQQQQSGCTEPLSTCEEQVKSLRRLLEQERLLSNNLKIDVSSLEETKQELMTNTMMLERERVAMEEELDKLRAVNMELNTDNEDLRQTNRSNSNRLKDLQVNYEKVRAELLNVQQQQQAQKRESSTSSPTSGETNGMLLMARDLSELKVKNGFLMRQLEIAREESARQLEDIKQVNEIQQRRSVEMALIELREKHLAELQQLRDELNDMKQKLAASQRQVSRHEEEVAGERERLRSMDRDWRREKGQLQQKIEQMDAQLALERRSNEFKVKEIESVVREKERDLISLQDKCVQLERDFKRLQNKYNLLEENSDSKQRSLSKDLEAKKRELGELIAKNHAREDEYFEQCKRFNSEKSTLSEALESLKRSYDEKLAELKSTRELLALRQEQSYKERLMAQERLDDLSGQLLRMSEHKTQSRLLEQQLQSQERQVESLRRDCLHLKEDKLKLKNRSDELEARCSKYEKQELISKTSSISSASGLFAKAKHSLSSSSSSSSNKATDMRSRSSVVDSSNQASADHQATTGNNSQMIERLTSKINDQRHLINMIKEQYEAAQMELKQAKLIQSSEKQKWQSFASQLQSRLNDCEEKLLFETSLTNRTNLDSACRRKFELKWSEERRNTMEIIQQQQAQNEILVRDFKKINQQHDLLRLHAKQLEANNQKLSKKLIEYQNQQQALSSSKRPYVDSTAERKLFDCKAEKETLVKQLSDLSELNESLLNLLRDQVRPLVDTVNKIMSAIEATNKQQTDESGRQSRKPDSADEGSKSTQRPLLTSNDRQPEPDDSPQRNDLNLSNQHQSRLARLFTKTPPLSPADQQQKSAKPSPAKSVKKVRVKSAALGLTPSEKRLLKERLVELSGAIEQLSSSKGRRDFPGGASATGRAATSPRSIRSFDHSHANSNDAGESSSTTTQSRVRWQLDDGAGSDLDSERSWSIQSENRPANLYRRFPQTSSANRQHQVRSLTDYESESSLAGSDVSLCQLAESGAGRLRVVSGVESDSCIASSNKPGLARQTKRRGLKMRFTDTLRSLSRSITGLASDSESESLAGPTPSPSKRRDASRPLAGSRPKLATLTTTGGDLTPTSQEHREHRENLKEIRV